MSSNSREPSPKLPVHTKFAYGLGSLAFGIKDQGFNTLLMLYYNQVIGLPAAWVGAAIMLTMVVDALSDPLIGHYSDHLRTRWGRRHPFMYASAVPVSVAYLLLWMPPAGGHDLQFLYLLVMSIIVRVAISCYEIPSTALISEFSGDYDERTSMSTYRSLFYAIGTVGMAVVALKVFLRPTPEQPIGQLNAAGYHLYAAAAGGLMLFSILISTLGTHHRIPSLRVQQEEKRPSLADFRGQLKAIVMDRTYSSVLLCAFFFAVGGGFATTLGVYINTYFWRLNADQLGTISGSMAWGVILALVVVQLSKKLGKKETAMVLFGVALLSIAAPVTLGLLGVMSAGMPDLIPILSLQAAVMVMCILAAMILATSMVADVGEHFELKTGKRTEGLMFAALIMINKAVSGMGVFLSGLALSVIGFPDHADPATIDPLAVAHLGWSCVIVVTFFCVLAIVALSFYPITRASHERALRELGRR
ncbi:MFS transporter [Solimonas terrae]|uniref:MFS transporter n=1 Tax=Solimonas terrae TaxID=1396819 RepID=A0A6M2BUG0_9GAMM|nr:MFS transporter [Solimonas terrae]NGY05841.1 hypothetical protein [Solimonas terrae]